MEYIQNGLFVLLVTCAAISLVFAVAMACTPKAKAGREFDRKAKRIARRYDELRTVRDISTLDDIIGRVRDMAPSHAAEAAAMVVKSRSQAGLPIGQAVDTFEKHFGAWKMEQAYEKYDFYPFLRV